MNYQIPINLTEQEYVLCEELRKDYAYTYKDIFITGLNTIKKEEQLQ